MKEIWEVVHDCDDEEGNPTCWSTEINHSTYGKYAWISLSDQENYVVEVDITNISALKNCTSLKSAKKWVTINLRQSV